MDLNYISKNYDEITKQINIAKGTYDRKDEINLVAVTKSVGVDEINYLYDLGIRNIAENRVQVLMEKYDHIAKPDLKIHFIGNLQTNKVKYIVDKVDMIHSLDNDRLANEINKRCEAMNRKMDVLIEINSGREESKSGVLPEETLEFCKKVLKYNYINLCGFMTIGPKSANIDEINKYFEETSCLIIDIWQKKLHNIGSPIISMGMSDSYVSAIKYGSNLLRIGNRFFIK